MTDDHRRRLSPPFGRRINTTAGDVCGMADVLSDEEVDERLPDEWERSGDEIVRTYEFDDYLAGVTFAVDVGEVAEEEFHHPEIVIGYKTVTVSLTSHEEGGLTEKDIRLANLFDDER
jgi:4a-hydroxytetrahydrobiopterin dehydratase